jgi:hypothetical protein
MRERGGGCRVGSLLHRCSGDSAPRAGPEPAPLENLMAALKRIHRKKDKQERKEKESNKL